MTCTPESAAEMSPVIRHFPKPHTDNREFLVYNHIRVITENNIIHQKQVVDFNYG